MAENRGVVRRVEAFSDRVLTVFATSVVTTGLGIVIGFVLARVLGPSGKGEYYLVTLIPVTIMVAIQFGLPQAFGYYAARGQTIRINAKILVITAVLAGPALALSIALMPILRETILEFIDPINIVLALAVVPFVLNATFTTGVVLGRQAVRWYSVVSVGQSLGAIVLFIGFVGVLGLGLTGALWAFFLLNCLSAVGFLVGSIRVSAGVPDPAHVSYRELLQYGLAFYPGSLTQFFSVRVDVYLLAWLLSDPAAPLGYYSMAVTMAQLLFFLPNAVSSLFFPHVAGSTRDEADRHVAMLSRVTLLMTGGMALVLVPTAIVLIRTLLPAFEPSLPPLFVILPGVVALSQTEVLSSYISGLGMAGWTSSVKVGALIVNVVLNLLLITRFGIVGAAAASLVSYSASAIAFSLLAARFSHRSPADFWIPRVGDVRFAVTTAVGIGRRVLRRAASLP